MRRVASAAAILFGLVIPGHADAQNTEWNRYTLEKLTGVYVEPEVGTECQSAGFDLGALQTAADSILETAGIGLLTEEGMLAEPGLPELKIQLECAPAGSAELSGIVAYSASVRLFQAVQMIRDPQITLSEGVTWYTTALGVARSEEVAAELLAAALAKVEEFAGAYTEANAG